MLRPLGLLACALALTLAAPAVADEPRRTSSFGWARMPGAEACVGPRDFALAVEQRLGRAVFVSATQAELIIEGHIEPVGQGFRAHLAVSDAKGAVLGTRDLDTPSADCRALDEQLALVVALLIDPEAALAPPSKRPSPPVVPQPVFVPVPADRSACAPPPPAPPKRWRAVLSAGPAFAGGLLPQPGVAFFVRGEIEPPTFVPIELGAAFWLDAHADVATTGSLPTKGATISLSYAMLGVCPLAWGTDATFLRACAEVEVGAIRSIGYGFTSPVTAGQEHVVGMASLAGRVARRIAGPLEIGLGLSLTVPFNRARFFYTDTMNAEHELFRMSPVSGVVDAEVSLAFP